LEKLSRLHKYSILPLLMWFLFPCGKNFPLRVAQFSLPDLQNATWDERVQVNLSVIEQQ
jgi:hypothetical protein